MNSREYYRLLGSGTHVKDEGLVLNDDVETHLQALTDVAELLGIDNMHQSNYLSAISEQSTREFTLLRTLMQLERAEELLKEHLGDIIHHEKLMQKWIDEIYVSEPTPQESVAIAERRTNALAAKARRYQRELESVMAGMTAMSSASVSELAAERGRLRQNEHELKLKRAKVETYMGLPPNIELARFELRSAEEEHKKLIDLRERLLANMAASVS